LPDSEQDVIAAWLLAEIESERKWDELFSSSQDTLATLAKEAMDEPSRGETKPWDED
jgi:hypothetical protein